MKIEHFGGLHSEKHNAHYFFEPMYPNSKDSAIVVLSNWQAQTLLNAYHTDHPLKTSFDRKDYGAFIDRDPNTQAGLIGHIFGGPLNPFKVEDFSIHSHGVGYTRDAFRALTYAMVTLDLPEIPVQISINELEHLTARVGQPLSFITNENFEQVRGPEYQAIRSSHTPIIYSHMKNFPFEGEKDEEVLKAAETNLFLLQHQGNSLFRLQGLLAEHNITGPLMMDTLAHKIEQNNIHQRAEQFSHSLEFVSALYDLNRRGIDPLYTDGSNPPLRWDSNIEGWHCRMLAETAYPLRPSERGRVVRAQTEFINSLPNDLSKVGPAMEHTAKRRLARELKSFNAGSTPIIGRTPQPL